MLDGLRYGPVGCATRAKALVCSPDIARAPFCGIAGPKVLHAADPADNLRLSPADGNRAGKSAI